MLASQRSTWENFILALFERRAVASDLMIQAVFMEENARSALKRVPWGKLTAVFAVAIVVAWVLGYLAGVFVRSGFGGLW